MAVANDSTSIWLITGCSTGLGRTLAERVLEHGRRGVVTAHNVDQIRDFAATVVDSVLTAALDVNNAEQVDDVIAQTEKYLAGLTCSPTTLDMASLPQSRKGKIRTYAPCSKPTSFHSWH